MKDSDDFAVDDLISQSEKLMEDLDFPENESSGNKPDMDKQALEKAQADFFLNEIEGNSFRSDGFVKIRISEDKMTAYADFYPPTEGMSPISYNQVMGILQEKKIVFGINNDNIQKCCIDCMSDMSIINDIVVAEGEDPSVHIPQYYSIDRKLLKQKKNPEKTKGRIDYKKVTPFILVQKGKRIAELVRETPGKPGHNVLGDEIPSPQRIENKLEPGQNTFIADDIVYAACDGLFDQDEKSFYINEVLQIESGVDYSTGNIDFPGDVLINGETKDGFQVKSGGRIFYTGTFDASIVECDDNLVVTLGIIGRKKGRIKAGGSIEAKFIENCFVESIKNISLVSGVMNSEIYTNGKLIAGEKGLVVGGIVYAQDGIEANQIGTSMGPRTELYCGTDYLVQSKMRWARDHSMEVAMELNKVNNQIARSGNPDSRLLEVQTKLKVALKKLNELSNELIFELHKNEDALVEVYSAIYPGVYIEICHFSYVVERVMGPSKFYLNKQKGIIVAEDLK
ncbi:MAG: DUF342 domain-containing protein [Spirochaetales bacterium]|nr:DUF342 domain-containing protein [Spirochaetales bacterium]